MILVLFTLSILSWLSFGSLWVSWEWTIFSKLSTLWVQSCPLCFFIIFLITARCIVMSSISFLILVLCEYSLSLSAFQRFYQFLRFFSSLYLFFTFFLCSDWTIFIHQSSFTFSSAISILFRPQLLYILALKFPFSISLCLRFLFWEFYFPFVLRVFLALFLVEEVL